VPKGLTQTPAANVKHVPILRFYDIGSPAGSTSMTVADFQSLVSWLAAQGYVPQYLSDYIRWMRGEIDLPRESCVLVFYGAFVSQYTQAFPYFQTLGLKFNLMIPAASIQNEGSLQTGIYFTLANLQTMVAAGLCEPHSNGFHLKWAFQGVAAAIAQLYTAAQINLKWGGLEELVEDAWSYAPLIGTNATGSAVQTTYAFTAAPRGYRLNALNPQQIRAAYLCIDHLSVIGTAYSPSVSIGVKRDQDASYSIVKASWTPSWNQTSQVVQLDAPFTFQAGVKYDLQFTTLSTSGGAAGELVSLGSRTAAALPETLDALTTYKIHPPPPPALGQVNIAPGYSIPQRTYYVKWTQVGPNGETIGSTEATINLAADYVCQVNTSLGLVLPSATAFNVYAGLTSGSEVLQTPTPINFLDIHNNLQGWTEPNTGLVTGTAAPPVNVAVLTPPAAPTLSTVPGGQLPTRTYYAVLTYVNADGETQPSIEASIAIAQGSLLQVASPGGESNAGGWNVYVSRQAGDAGSLEEALQNSTPIPIGLSWTEPQTGLVAGPGIPILPTGLAPVATICSSNSSAPGYAFGEQIGADIYLLESLAVETVAQMQSRVLADAQANLNFLSPYLRPQELDVGYAYAFDTYNVGTGALSSPAAPALSQLAGGNLPAQFYYAVATYLNANGETLASVESVLQVSAGYLLHVASPPPIPGATGWNVYVAGAIGGEVKQNGAPLPIGTAWTESSTGIRGPRGGGVVPPAANGTGVFLPQILRAIHPLQMSGAPLPGDRWSNLDPSNNLGAPSSFFPLRQITPVLNMTGTTALSVLENQIGAFSGALWDVAPDWTAWTMAMGWLNEYAAEYNTELKQHARGWTHLAGPEISFVLVGPGNNLQLNQVQLVAAQLFLQRPEVQGAKILVRLTNNADASVAHQMFVNQSSGALAAIQNLIQQQLPGIAGIALDIEGALYTDRSPASAWIRQLRQSRDANFPGYLILAAAPAKTSDSPTDPWAGWMDYSVWGAQCDVLNPLTYGYSDGSASQAPGPSSPLSWMQSVFSYASSVVPKAKLMIGVSFYGTYRTNGPTNWRAPLFADYYGSLKLAYDSQAAWTWDSTNSEWYWTSADGTQKGYQPTPQSMKARLDYFSGQGYTLFSAWALGQGDGLFYENAEDIYALAPLLRLPSGPAQRVNDREGSSSVGNMEVEILENPSGSLGDAMRQIQLTGKKARFRLGYSTLQMAQFYAFETFNVDRVELNEDQTGWKLQLMDTKRSFKSRIFVGASKQSPLEIQGNPMDVLLMVCQNYLGVGQNPAASPGAPPTGGWIQYVPGNLATLINPNKYLDVAAILNLKSGIFRNYFMDFTIAEPADAKGWIEKEVFKPLGGYPIVDSQGRLSPRFWFVPNYHGVLGYEVDFNFSDHNLIEIPVAEKAPIVNALQFRMDYDGSKFKTVLIFESGDSISAFGIQGTQIIESRGLQSGRQGALHASILAEKLFRRYDGTAFANMGLSPANRIPNIAASSTTPLWNVEAFHSALAVEVGDWVTLTHPLALDPVTNTRGVTNLLCEVLEKQPHYDKGNVSFKLLDVRYIAALGGADYAPIGEPAWASAPPGDRARMMFVASDSNGMMTDGSTPSNSIYG